MTTSSMGVRTTAQQVATGAGMYSASKAAAEMLMKYAAIEVGQASLEKQACSHCMGQTEPVAEALLPLKSISFSYVVCTCGYCSLDILASVSIANLARYR